MKRIFSLLCLLLFSFNVSSQTSDASEVAINYLNESLKKKIQINTDSGSIFGNQSEKEDLYDLKLKEKTLSYMKFEVVSSEILDNTAIIKILLSIPALDDLTEKWEQRYFSAFFKNLAGKELSEDEAYYLSLNITQMTEKEMDDLINEMLPDDEVRSLDLITRKKTLFLKKKNNIWTVDKLEEEGLIRDEQQTKEPSEKAKNLIDEFENKYQETLKVMEESNNLINKKTEEYVEAIQKKIESYWHEQKASNALGLYCSVNIKQLTTGEIVSISFDDCNADKAQRESIETAVYNASPLPISDHPDVFEESIRFIF